MTTRLVKGGEEGDGEEADSSDGPRWFSSGDDDPSGGERGGGAGVAGRGRRGVVVRRPWEAVEDVGSGRG